MTHKEYRKSLQPDKNRIQGLIKTNAYIMSNNGEITTEQRDMVLKNLDNMWAYWRDCWIPIRSARNAIKDFLRIPHD